MDRQEDGMASAALIQKVRRGYVNRVMFEKGKGQDRESIDKD